MAKIKECKPAEHNFIPLYNRQTYIGVVCSNCSKRIKEVK